MSISRKKMLSEDRLRDAFRDFDKVRIPKTYEFKIVLFSLMIHDFVSTCSHMYIAKVGCCDFVTRSFRENETSYL